MSDLRKGENAGSRLKAHWVHTSSNDIVKRLAASATPSMRRDLEALMAGGAILKQVAENVAYPELGQGGEHLWGFMLFTGYLTTEGERLGGEPPEYRLRIPNAEVASLYVAVVKDWFARRMKALDLSAFRAALVGGDAPALQREVTAALFETISYHDYGEDFYHGFLAGMLQAVDGYDARSNRESGLGRADVQMVPHHPDLPFIVLEFKTTKERAQLEAKCEEALAQASAQGYGEEAAAMGYAAVLRYGVAFWKKQALVRLG
jgi:hypothetical protein